MCEGKSQSASRAEVGAAETVAEGGGTCPLRPDSHVLWRWGGRVKWDRERQLQRSQSLQRELYNNRTYHSRTASTLITERKLLHCGAYKLYW